MGTGTKESIKMKVFPKGQVVIPVSLRKKYQIDIGDRIDVISKSDGILLKPLPKENRQRSLTERLFGIFSDYAAVKTRSTKTDIEKATEAGFTEGWNK
ncbi:MAG: AbrB/MazE/SpoVT family DNA-binding domain-containing protein [Desulfobacterales bacterium]